METRVLPFIQKPLFAAAIPAVKSIGQPQFSAASRSADSLTLQQPVRFGSKLDKNLSVSYNLSDDIGYFHMAQIQQALMRQSLTLAAKGEADAHVTFFADMDNDPRWPAMLNGIADTIIMTDRPVDVAVKTYAGPMGLKLLVSATGKRYMYPAAVLQFGEPYASAKGTMKQMNNDLQIFSEDQRTLEWEVMQAAGVASRERVRADLQKGEDYTSLMALAYGKKGLVDAVVVGENELLTRSALNRYMHAHRAEASGLQNLVRQVGSLEKVTQWARQEGLLEAFDDKSLTREPVKLAASVLEEEKDDKKKKGEDPDILKALLTLLGSGHEDLVKRLKGETEGEEKDGDKDKFKITGYADSSASAKSEELESARDVITQGKPKGNGRRMEFSNVPASLRHAYGRDAVFFATSFNLESLHLMTAVLQNIIEKKQKQKAEGLPVSNGLIVENSPGGYLAVLNQWLNKLNTTDVPFDVVVQGWGTSCGAMLINGATGNRFVTPNGHSLIHQLSAGERGLTSKLETGAEGRNRLNKTLRHLIATRTGRPEDQVKLDMQADLDLNAVEMMLYGPNGFADSILVGPDKILTREAVFNYVAEKLGGADKVEPYVNARLADRREADHETTFETHKEVDADPLGNPMVVIKDLVARGKAVPMDSVEAFKPSLGDVAGDKKKTIDYYEVTAEEADEE